MIFTHLEGILVGFWNAISNRRAELSNFELQALKRIALGYRSIANFRIADLIQNVKRDLTRTNRRTGNPEFGRTVARSADKNVSQLPSFL